MKRIALSSLFFTFTFAAVSAAQAPTWRAELLGTPPPTWSTVAVSAVNDSGLTVGNTYLSGFKHAWIAGPNQPLELLPLSPGANWSEATDINSSGVVSGSVLVSGASQGVLWQPGPSGYQIMHLPTGPGGLPPISARGLNDAGEVVGKLGPLSGSYYWTAAAGLTQLPTSTFPVVPEDINNQRQIIGDTFRMDLDTLVLEDLGNPTGTGFNYIFSKLSVINDAGQCGGYANVATGMSQSKQAVRYTDGAGWMAFNSIPLITANVMGIAANGDTVYQLGNFGLHVWTDGFGNIPLQSTLDPAFAHFDLSSAFAPFISPGSLMATNGMDTLTGQSGVVLLTPFDPNVIIDRCSGDGGDQMGCTGCPCGNDAPQGTIGGCLNSASTSGRLLASGTTSIAAADLRFDASGIAPLNTCVLLSGDALAPQNPANPCFAQQSGVQSIALDGLRCVVNNTLRHGTRPSDANGDVGVTTNGWGAPDGFFQFNAFTSGETKHFQVFHRDNGACKTGQNTSQAISVVFTP